MSNWCGGSDVSRRLAIGGAGLHASCRNARFAILLGSHALKRGFSAAFRVELGASSCGDIGTQVTMAPTDGHTQQSVLEKSEAGTVRAILEDGIKLRFQ